MPVSPFVTDFAQALIDFDFNVKTINVHSETLTPDGQGGNVSSFSLFSTSSGFVLPMTAQEKIDSGRLATDQIYKVLVYPIANISTKMKIIYNGDDLNIRSIVDVAEDSSLMIIIAEKGVAQ